MRLPDLQRIARIAMTRCTREAKFEEVQRHYINIYHCCGATEGSEQHHNQDLKEIY